MLPFNHLLIMCLYFNWCSSSIFNLCSLNANPGAVVKSLPSPITAQAYRMPKLWPSISSGNSKLKSLREAVRRCDSKSAHVLVFVSKMVSLDHAITSGAVSTRKTRIIRRPYVKGLHELKARAFTRTDENKNIVPSMMGSNNTISSVTSNLDNNGDTQTLISPSPKMELKVHNTHTSTTQTFRFYGFSRIFSGTLRIGDTIYVISSTSSRNASPKNIKVTHLFLLMGRHIENVKQVYAGTVFGIAGKGLEDNVLHSATLCSSPDCKPILPMKFQVAFICCYECVYVSGLTHIYLLIF